MSISLGVNIDHIATLRQARGIYSPDLLQAAKTVVSAGADLIVVHLRSDRRHIQDEDVFMLKRMLNTHLHIEMAATKEMEEIMLKLKPQSVCIVPETPDELTTQGGLKLDGEKLENIKRITKNLKDNDIEVSLFLDPEPNDIRRAHSLGAYAVELSTKVYSEVPTRKQRLAELERLQLSAVLVRELKMELHAGHGLDYDNVLSVANIDGMDCLNIGFSIISRAVFSGLTDAVQEMKKIINQR